MTHTGNEWTITVHREFEDFLKTWKGQAETGDTTGVLHIGFTRPAARQFDQFVSAHEGRLLITAAAKFALPEGYTASEGVIGFVEELPVHLGIRGWGYEIPEDAIPNAERSVRHSVSEEPATGWIKKYLEVEPDHAELLSVHGIFDDRSYFEREAELPWDVRRSLGIFRYKETFSGEQADPCAVARASPPWLLSRKFETIDVSVRVTNVFVNMNIVTISDLAKVTLEDLLDTRNFGRKSVNDLLGALQSALNEGPTAAPPYDLRYGDFQANSLVQSADQNDAQPDDDLADNKPLAQFGQRSLIDAIRLSLQRFDERTREIVFRRMGLGQRSETLQELGDRFGVTRERIRQIESKAIGRLIKRETWDDDLTAKLSSIVKGRSMPLPLRGIEGADSWFEGLGSEGEALAYLLENLSETQVSIVEIDGTQYLGVLSQREWDEAAQSACRLLESGVEQNWSFTHSRALVTALLPERCGEFRELLWEQAARKAHFIERDGTSVLSGYGRGAENFVYAALSSSPHPIHYSEIPALVATQYDHEIDVRRAHNAAAEIGLLFGRGLYGLDKHISLSEETMKQLAEEASQVIVEGPAGRQWHCAELVAELVERDIADSSKVDKYLLNIALKRSNGLKHLGRLVWSLADEASESDTYRIDIRQAIIVALEEAGGPLSTGDIKERVSASRGVDKLFQMYPYDPVIRVAPGVWGLNDRDLPIKRGDQGRFLDTLVELLRDRGSGLHYAELDRSTALKSWGLSVTAFFSLATADPRLRVSTGRYLYLDEWGGPRRESLGQAVRGVLLESDHPLEMAEIVERVSGRLKRSVERPAVSSQLQAAEARYNPLEGTWSMAQGSVAESEADSIGG